MKRITHILLIIILFIICIWAIFAFTSENTKIDQEDLGNSSNVNQTIENITNNNVSYNNGEALGYMHLKTEKVG